MLVRVSCTLILECHTDMLINNLGHVDKKKEKKIQTNFLSDVKICQSESWNDAILFLIVLNFFCCFFTFS